MLALAVVDVGGRGRNAPEGLEAEFAVDDLVVLFLWSRDEAADAGEGAKSFALLAPGECTRLIGPDGVGQDEDAFFGDFDVHSGS